MTIWLWVGFIFLILLLLTLDLGVFHRRDRVISTPEALAWTAFWIACALVFNVAVYFAYEHHWLGIGQAIGHELTGKQAALQFLTGYVIEKSLSLDNIFVFAVIFTYFAVPLDKQHRVLFWGVIGALVMRGLMIALGAVLIASFEWITYVFGGLLLLTAVKMLVVRHDNIEPDKNPLIRLARRLYPVSPHYEGPRFFTRVNGERAVTPLMLVLLMVESSDLLFAIDSIPAIFAITRDPFIVFTSNVFAILGLRSLYFAIAGLMNKFHFLKISLVFILAFVGMKMILAHHHPIPTWVSLSMISGILLVGIVASVIGTRRDSAPPVSPVTDELTRLAKVSLKQARKIVVIMVGSSLLVIGAAMLVLPGPAVVVIPIALAILATEFVWARRLLRRIRQTIRGSGCREQASKAGNEKENGRR